jgi:hypothetical protein
VFQPIHNNVGTPDRDAPAVVGALILNVGIVNDKGSRAEIGVGLDHCRTVFPADVVGRSLIGFRRQSMLIGEGMGRSDGVYIIGFAVAPGAEVTIVDQPIGFEFNNILRGYIDL